jgi:hypothetical protein
MSILFRTLAIASLAFQSGCGTLSREPHVTRVVPVVAIDLVGTDRFRLGTGGELMTREQLLTYFHTLFARHDPRVGRYRYTIILHSYDCPPPDTIGREPEHIAPVLDIARQYGCSLTIIYPEQAGPDIVGSYYESFPSRRHQRN